MTAGDKTWLVLVDGYQVARVEGPSQEVVWQRAIATYGSRTGLQVVEELEGTNDRDD